MSVEESKSLGELTAPAIIISASGMASGGRVLHHLRTASPESTQLCEWVESLETRPRTIFFVHGAEDASAALELRLRELEQNAVTPRQFERVRLP